MSRPRYNHYPQRSRRTSMKSIKLRKLSGSAFRYCFILKKNNDTPLRRQNKTYRNMVENEKNKSRRLENTGGGRPSSPHPHCRCRRSYRESLDRALILAITQQIPASKTSIRRSRCVAGPGRSDGP